MELLNVIFEFAQNKGVVSILVLSLVNAALGAAVALQNNEFDLRRLADTFGKIAPYLIAYVATLALNNPALEVAVLGTIIASQTSGVVKHLGNLFPSLTPTLPDLADRN